MTAFARFAQRPTAALAAIFALTLGLAVAAPADSAAAATPKCTQQVKQKSVPGYSYYMMIPASDSRFSCYMNWGTSNRGVQALQAALHYCYGVIGRSGIDGVYGGETADAVRRVQIMLFPFDASQHDGVYGPITASNIDFPWHNPSNDSIMSTCTNRRGN